MSEKDTTKPMQDRLSAEIRPILRRHMRKYFGSSPEEVQETYKVLEGVTPAEIREAVKLYREKRK